MNTAHLLAVARTDLRILGRVRWVQAAAAAGVLIAVLIALQAGGESGIDRVDTLRSGSASLLLLGGLVVAVGLGAGAFAHDAAQGYLGLLVGTGVTPSTLGAGRLLARLLTLTAIVAAWGVTQQAGSLVLGEGLDGPLAVHGLTVLENLVLVLCGSAALASVIGPVAAGVFGVMVYISAQAAVNLKAALDQQAVNSDARVLIEPFHAVFPRALVSPMIADMQARGVAGPSAPRVDVNGLPVLVPSSTWVTVVWTLIWAGAFAGLAAYGVRRRQL